MKKWLLLGVVGLVLGCGGEDDDEGTQCCALKRYCQACAYCSSDERTIGNSGDETSCKQINDGFIDRGRYCSDTDRRTPIVSYIAECSSD